MKCESKVICDSNICIFRTLHSVLPPVYNQPILSDTVTYLANITNNNYNCKLIITDTIKEELINADADCFILIKEIQKFCVERGFAH